MEFFNQKEEVIDLKLTQHGKRLLAAGEFAPMYYAFFDKDILYNSEFGGFNEEQNDTETRIKDKTPRLKTQHNFVGVETQFHALKKIVNNKSKTAFAKDKSALVIEKLQETENKFFAPNSAVGNTQVKNAYAPSWDIKFYNENLQSISKILTSSASPNIKIPQMQGEIEYKAVMTNDPSNINIKELPDRGSGEFGDDQETLQSEPLEFEDGSMIILQDDFFLLGIDEKNTDFFNENFEIEFYMEETPTDTLQSSGLYDDQKQTKLIPLKFASDNEEDDFDLDMTEDTTFVKYFLDVKIDEEIPLNILCNYVYEDDKKSFYVKQIFNCGDKTPDPLIYGDIYEDEDIGEPCE